MRILEIERRRQGLSQAGLARGSGLNQATISQIESGYIGKPYPSQLEKLKEALGYDDDAAKLLDEVPDNVPSY